MAQPKVKFVTGTIDKYKALAVKDSSTLYFIEDAGKIYKGSADMTSSVIPVPSFTSRVTNEIEGKLYVCFDSKEVRMVSNKAWVIISPGYITKAEEMTEENGSKLVSVSAVKPYIDTEIEDAKLSWKPLEQ